MSISENREAGKNEMKKTRNIAFIVELLLLFVLLLFVIVVITKTFMASRSQSLYAKHLTEAVCLAEDVAEVRFAAADKAEALALLAAMEQTQSIEDDGQIIWLTMDFADAGGGTDRYRIGMDWNEEPSAQGTYFEGEIRVYYQDIAAAVSEKAAPIYTLSTGDYRSGGAR